MSKIINDENINELDTSQEELVTENYALEILGLKNIADFRKFSRSFAKLDKIVKELDNETKEELEKKLDKGENLEEGYNTAVKIVSDVKKKQYKEDSALKTSAKNIVGAINELSTNKFEKGTVSTDYDTAEKIEDKVKSVNSSKANKTTTVTGTGILSGGGDLTTNRTITHRTGAGYNHIPSGGASGQVVKYSRAGTGVWGKVTWSEVDGKPSTMPPSAHKHTKTEITDFPSSLKNPSVLTISLNGTSQGAYDGSSAKSINVTASSVGAYTKAEVDSKLGGKANSSHSHKATEIAQDSTHRMVSDTEKNTWNNKLNKTSVVNNLTTNDSSKALSASMGKRLNDDKLEKFNGIIRSLEDLNNATRTGLYTVSDYAVAGLYGYGFLYVYENGNAQQQLYFSHHNQIAFRQDWQKNVTNIAWKRIPISTDITTAVNSAKTELNTAINKKLTKGNLPAKITDAKGLYDLIENNSGLNFDTALLYLNDAGTKYVDKIYFDRNKKGMFKCIAQTISTTNSTSYFVDISNEANADQLRNLNSFELLYENITNDTDISKIYDYKFIQVIIQASTKVQTITHEQYSIVCNPKLGFCFNNNFHSLGSISIKIDNSGKFDKNLLLFNGTALGKFEVKYIYGFN